METTLAVKVTPLSPACGAMIEGVDLAEDLPDATIALIKDAWAKHLVLVFRGQTITQEQQLRFAARFGELGERKVGQAREELRSRAQGVLQDDNRVMLVSNIKIDGNPVGAFGDGEMWFHIDSGYSARPYKYTFLYAQELPSTGGNTRFANMYKAYDAVPAELKARLEGRRRSTSTNTSAPPRSTCPPTCRSRSIISTRSSPPIPKRGARRCSSTG